MKDIANDFHIGKREDPVQRERAAPRAPGGLEDGAGPHGEGHLQADSSGRRSRDRKVALGGGV